MGALGEAGISHDDVSYTGEVSTSTFSMDYVRGRIREYQSTLDALDRGYQAALLAIGTPGLPDESRADLETMVSDFQSKRWTLKATAEALNLGAAAINAAGGRLPQLSIPGTLGALPLALPFAAVAAVGTAATLMVWGHEWLRGVNDRLKTAQLLAAQSSPETAADLARSIAESDAALQIADGSTLGAFASVLKWGAIAVGAFMLYRAVAPMLKR